MKTPPDIDSLIQEVRGQKVILDADLAELYGVATKMLNRAVKRNAARFPEDFVFRLTAAEMTVLRCQIGTSKNEPRGRGGRRTLPCAFTGHGTIMAATVLNSKQAVAMSLYVVRGFVKLREQLVGGKDILRRLAEIDKTLLKHDLTLKDVLKKLQPLLDPPQSPRRMIGFHP